MKYILSLSLLVMLTISSVYARNDSTMIMTKTYNPPPDNTPKILAVLQDIYVTGSSTPVSFPGSCPPNRKVYPICSLVNTDYAYCNISEIKLTYKISGNPGNQSIQLFGSANSSSCWFSSGVRGLHATCSIYCIL